MQTSIGLDGTDAGLRPVGVAEPERASDGRRRRKRKRPTSPPAPPLAAGRLADLPEASGYRGAILEALDRIDDWVPKGVHFGWEASFKNKGKFPAAMNKEAARRLVAHLLHAAPLAVYENARDGQPVDQQFRVVVDAGAVVGSRGQERIRVIIVRDGAGFVIENAFPVYLR